MKIFIIFSLLFGMAVNALAVEKAYLYGEYYAGMSSEDVFKSGPAQCDTYPDGKKICNRQHVVFAGHEWTQFFEFKNNALTCVAFGRPLSLNAINIAMAWLQDENYTPVDAEAGKESISFSLLLDKNGKSEFEKEYRQFNRNLPSADRIKAYLVKRSLLKDNKTMDKMPEDAIVVTLGGSKSIGALFLCFDLAKNFKITSFIK